MPRVEHFHDPDAPPANSLVPAATAVVVNEAGELLVMRRADDDLWALPGGAMDIGEMIAQTAVREVKEERPAWMSRSQDSSASTPTPTT